MWTEDIYGLTDPRTNEIKYIGRAVSAIQRWYAHRLRCNAKTNSKKDIWLRELFDLGLKPGLIILETINYALEGFNRSEVERFWIEYFTMLGANLTNVTPFNRFTRYGQNWYDSYRSSRGLPLQKRKGYA